MSTGKRVRIDPNATTGTSKKQPTAPLTTALNLIRTTAASLQPTLADIFTQHASQYVNQLANLANKVKQLEKMEQDTEFYPRSTRLQFTLHMSKQAEQHQDYQGLQEDMNLVLQQSKDNFKLLVIRATKIEIEILRNSILTTVVQSTRLLTQAFAIGRDNIGPIDNILITIMNEHHSVLLQHTTYDLEQYKTRYISENSTVTWLPPDTDMDTDTTPQPPAPPVSPFLAQVQARRLAQGLATPTPTVPTTAPDTPVLDTDKTRLCTAVKRALQTMLVTSWDEYLRQQKVNEVSLQMKKLHTNQSVEQATDEVAALVDSEVSAPPEMIEQLITKKANAANKKLQSDVSQLTDQVKQLTALVKKSTRGQTGASKKKEKKSTKPSSGKASNSNKKEPKQKKGSADANANASSKNKGRGRSRNGRRQRSRSK